MENNLAVIDNPYEAAIRLTCDSLASPNSRRAYEKALTSFLNWCSSQPKSGLTKMLVNRYKAVLRESGVSSSTINLNLSAIRKFIKEAADNNLIDQTVAHSIMDIEGVVSHGERTGHWLTVQEATALINTPDRYSLSGLRDRAVLSVMIGSGLRRSEVAALMFKHIQFLEDRWVILDLVGKANHMRTIPLPLWAKTAIDAWTTAAGVRRDHIFRPISKSGEVIGLSVTPQTIHDIVVEHGEKFGVAPHDLRRTFAKLSLKGGARIEQIQLSLGHKKIDTTQKYLGVDQDMRDAPADHLGIDL